MTHPYVWLAPSQRWLLLALAGFATLALAVTLASQARDLRMAPQVPEGMLSYEFAWTLARVHEILSAWGAELREVAHACLVRDFAFLVTYPVALSVACAIVSDVSGAPYAPVAVFLSWAVLAAIPLEILENLGLLGLLAPVTAAEARGNLVARFVGICAGLKFSLGFAAIGYILLAEIGLIADRLGLTR
ncbi:MAG: hypothetical protein GC151_20540 [Betaproteobacteria bacterium]|nr:hypothetical protein [Betaproteobacteria bacterium]